MLSQLRQYWFQKGGEIKMGNKFLGIGLTNAIGLWCLFMIFSLVAKTVFTKYEVEGLSEVVRAGA